MSCLRVQFIKICIRGYRISLEFLLSLQNQEDSKEEDLRTQMEGMFWVACGAQFSAMAVRAHLSFENPWPDYQNVFSLSAIWPIHTCLQVAIVATAFYREQGLSTQELFVN